MGHRQMLVQACGSKGEEVAHLRPAWIDDMQHLPPGQPDGNTTSGRYLVGAPHLCGSICRDGDIQAVVYPVWDCNIGVAHASPCLCDQSNLRLHAAEMRADWPWLAW